MKTLRRYTIPACLALVALTLSFLGLYTLVHAQGVSYPGTPIALTRGGFPASGATVTVCTGVVTVTLANSPPCAPYATIYSDSGLTLPITQPGFKTDGLGNYPFFVAAGGGAYTVVLTGNGFTGTSTVWVAPLIGTLPNVFSGLQTFDAALALKEIAAPSGLANYEVLYGNTATHRLVVKLNNAAEDAIVTDAGTATLLNKTLTSPVATNPSITGTDSGAETQNNKTFTGASNGNAMQLLDNQAPTAALTGDGTNKTIFTYTIPANTVGAGKGVRVCAFATHNAGAANVAFLITLGGTNVHSWTDTAGIAAVNGVCAEFLTSPGVQNVERSMVQSIVNGGVLNVGGVTAAINENFANALAVKFTFNVAATDQVTGTRWSVQLIN